MERHLAKVHPGAAALAGPVWPGATFFGLLRCEIVADDTGVTLKRALGLGRRIVRFPCAVETGTLTRQQLEAGAASYADDMNVRSSDVPAGSYLRLVGEADLVLGCRQKIEMERCWEAAGWTRGPRRGSAHVMVERGVLVRLEYLLARRGLLVPASAVGT
jgi:hypothetical protein